MRTVLAIFVLAIGYDGLFQDFKVSAQAYNAVDSMFESVTDAM